MLDCFQMIQWKLMEEMQQDYPYYWWGWDGYVPIVVWC